MTYDVFEYSDHDGSPVELYRIVRGPKVWTLTSGDSSYDYNGETYTPVAISRGKIEDTADLAKSELRVTLPGNHDVPLMFAPFPPGEVVTLSIFERHWLDGDAETLPLWTGRILSCVWENDLIDAVLICEPRSKSLLKPGLTRGYSRGCEYTLFDQDCGLNKDAHRVNGTVQSFNGNELVVANAALHADGHFDGGWVYWYNVEGYVDHRMIGQHVGDTLTLSIYIPGMKVGDPLYLLPGCDHTLNTCWTKFLNGLNYGGFPYQPGKNPFGGNPIF